MNRTERLYALVEELRAVAPRPRSATWLARRFEVSARTLTYAGGAGPPTTRDVEPLGLVQSHHWYLIGWCRLRDGIRGFRLDRITAIDVLDAIPAPRDDSVLRREMARFDLRPLDG